MVYAAVAARVAAFSHLPWENQVPPSILFITLDSCRYDAFVEASARNLKAVGPLIRAMAPSYFTYASHAAFFMGFTPGDAQRQEPFVNPKFGKIFRMEGGGDEGPAPPYMTLRGRNIIDGLKNVGYRTIGTGAVGWFDPQRPTGRVLSVDFDAFAFAGGPALKKQLLWIDATLAKLRPEAPAFVFLNLAETHLPYWHEGASWQPSDRTCLPFAADNDAAESRRRQVACIEFCDAELAGLLERFANGTIIVCSDHGDCWGEDGLWAHGISHQKTLEVPLLLRFAPTTA